jgi:hypothetical protein
MQIFPSEAWSHASGDGGVHPAIATGIKTSAAGPSRTFWHRSRQNCRGSSRLKDNARKRFGPRNRMGLTTR